MPPAEGSCLIKSVIFPEQVLITSALYIALHFNFFTVRWSRTNVKLQTIDVWKDFVPNKTYSGRKIIFGKPGGLSHITVSI